MFTVKLGTGSTFKATASNHYRSQINAFDNTLTLALRIECTPAEHEDLQWYLDKLGEKGALDRVQVICENGTVGFDVTGYTEISTVDIRLLDTGEKTFSLTLIQPEKSSK